MNKESGSDASIAGPSGAVFISSDIETDSSNDNSFTIVQTRKFCPLWLGDPAFKPWLQRVQGNAYKGKCTFCNVTMKAKKSNLQQHAQSQKHTDNMMYGKRVAPGEITFVDEVKEAEIRVCTDAIEHNRPFYSFDHFVKMVQEAFKNPNVLKRMSLSRKKMKAISVNVINKSIVLKTTYRKTTGQIFFSFDRRNHRCVEYQTSLLPNPLRSQRTDMYRFGATSSTRL